MGLNFASFSIETILQQPFFELLSPVTLNTVLFSQFYVLTQLEDIEAVY